MKKWLKSLWSVLKCEGRKVFRRLANCDCVLEWCSSSQWHCGKRLKIEEKDCAKKDGKSVLTVSGEEILSGKPNKSQLRHETTKTVPQNYEWSPPPAPSGSRLTSKQPRLKDKAKIGGIKSSMRSLRQSLHRRLLSSPPAPTVSTLVKHHPSPLGRSLFSSHLTNAVGNGDGKNAAVACWTGEGKAIKKRKKRKVTGKPVSGSVKKEEEVLQKEISFDCWLHAHTYVCDVM